MAMQGKLALAALATLAGVLVGGCQVSAPPDVWVAGQMVRLTNQSTRAFDPLVYDAQTRTTKLLAAGNETTSFQLVIDAGRQALSGLRISWTDLAAGGAKIARQEIHAFRCLPVAITGLPAWYAVLVSDNKPAAVYDALVGLEADRPLDLAAGERLVVWFDVSVPADAQAGVYSGDLAVRCLAQELWTGQVRLEVLGFSLPDTLAILAIGGFDHQEFSAAMVSHEGKPFHPVRLDQRQAEVRQLLEGMRQMSRLARAHGLDLFETQLRPLLKRDRTGAVQLVWDDYDGAVTPYLDGSAFEDGRPIVAWPMPFSQLWPVPRHYGGQASPEYVRTSAELQAACREHFTKLGAPAGTMFAWPLRVTEAQTRAELVAVLRKARQGNPRLQVLCQLTPMPQDDLGDLRDLAEMIAVPAERFDPNLATGRPGDPNLLAGTWLMPGEGLNAPSLGPLASAADVCALVWSAALRRCRGIFLPRAVHWSNDPFATMGNPETQLLYPGRSVGSPEVLASLRLKWLHRGLQDAAYLELLRQRGQEDLAEPILRSLVGGMGAASLSHRRFGQWEQDPTAWEIARRLLVREAEAALNPAKRDSPLLREQRQTWKSYHEQTHSLGVGITNCRLHIDTEKGKVQADIRLDLSNPLPRPMRIAAAWKNLPEGWSGIPAALLRRADPSPRIVNVPAGGNQDMPLAAEGPLAPCGGDAKVILQADLTIDGQETRTVDIPVPLLLAGIAASPPVIDGALDDWPMLEGNAAGDFRRVLGRGQQSPQPAKRKTQAFVLCDQSALYVALRCQEPNPASLTAATSNVITYEQMLPCNEDLVEIILDPGGSAESPENLYHVVVKPNGALLAEGGIGAGPPLGKPQAWASAATVAVGRQKDAWVVELAIPLSSFGPAARARQWRVNFARFAAQGKGSPPQSDAAGFPNEASSWAAVDRHFYEIDELGTMVLPSSVQTGGGEAASQP